jgi:hypothetical protein
MTHSSSGGARRQAREVVPAAMRALPLGDRPQGRQ